MIRCGCVVLLVHTSGCEGDYICHEVEKGCFRPLERCQERQAQKIENLDEVCCDLYCICVCKLCILYLYVDSYR